jgi:hypothetical protein
MVGGEDDREGRKRYEEPKPIGPNTKFWLGSCE